MTGRYTTLDRELRPAVAARDPEQYIDTVNAWRTARLLEPLAVACFYGHTEMAELLLDQGLDPNRRNRLKGGETPLHIAVEKENAALVRLLVRHGAGLLPDHLDRSPREAYDQRKRIWTSKTEAEQQTEAEVRGLLDELEIMEPAPDPFDAAIHGDVETLRALLDAGRFAVDETDIEETTPLLAAAEHGQAACAEVLIAHGADVNHVAQPTSGHEVTPLLRAIDERQLPVIKLLLAHGADVNAAVDFDGCTPLMRILRDYNQCEPGFEETYAENRALFEKWPPRQLGLHDLEIVELLLQAGADVNHVAAEDPDCAGCTPLHYAATLGRVALVETLLRFGADRDARNNEGDRPVDFLEYSYNDDEDQLARIRARLTPS